MTEQEQTARLRQLLDGDLEQVVLDLAAAVIDLEARMAEQETTHG